MFLLMLTPRFSGAYRMYFFEEPAIRAERIVGEVSNLDPGGGQVIGVKNPSHKVSAKR